MNALRMAVAATATTALALALARSSGARVRWHEEGTAQVELSWSARPERIETCRRLSDAELAARPAHMRQRMECEGSSATYALHVSVDGVMRDSAVVTGGGLRQDRPIFLLRTYAVSPGEHALRVEFTRRERSEAADSTEQAGEAEEARSGDAREVREAQQRRGRRLAALPPHLLFDQKVRFGAGEVVLLTVEQGTLVARQP